MNRVKNLINRITSKGPVAVVSSVVLSTLLITGFVNAATTISTSILTAGDITTSAGNIAATTGTLTIGGTSTLTGDVTLSGGDGALTLTSTNSATSTLEVGCIEMAATSTATKVRLLFTASTTADAISGTQAGFVLWGYGTCPF